ncbi:ATP synthase B chain [Marinobacter nitratireducens]|uniref:ATP synthase subunit b n=1 Tax=Marinobacter nitratireducens TaxID=1137280 RepID=A0A072N4U7_9GAMM|nr:hypothetical protein [Marinobacter nitratireducens]KEF32729.1 ATP synthase B chain [Marinobacter nitratireducens]
MEIDWITVSAQVVNFLILVWLLKRFLYQPVIHAMDKRENRIRSRMTTAEQRERAANQARQDYERKLADLEQQQASLLAEAEKEARQSRRDMIEQARIDTAEARNQWMQEVKEEKASFIKGVQQQSLFAVESIARRALEDLADEQLEERITHTFIDQLSTLDQGIIDTLSKTRKPATLSSSFELAPDLKNAISRELQTAIGAAVPMTFQRSERLICGIELVCEGHVLSWNLSDYLTDLTSLMEKAFETARSREPEA